MKSAGKQTQHTETNRSSVMVHISRGCATAAAVLTGLKMVQNNLIINMRSNADTNALCGWQLSIWFSHFSDIISTEPHLERYSCYNDAT